MNGIGADRPDRPQIIDEIRAEVMSAARRRPTGRLAWLRGVPRRLSLPLAIALALPVGAGIAVASGSLSKDAPSVSHPVYELAIDDGGPPMQGVGPGGVVGYLDLGTGELINCPDGNPLTRKYGERQPICPDGTTPARYVEQEAAWEQFLGEQENSATPEPPENGPNFQVNLRDR